MIGNLDKSSNKFEWGEAFGESSLDSPLKRISASIGSRYIFYKQEPP